ncbi:RNase II stability modulator [Oxalobacteraceae bacterium]
MTISVWMIGLFILLTLLWVSVELSLRQEEDRVRSYARHQAILLANSYATQLTFLTEQMNQILLGIHARWQDTPDLLDLALDRKRGLFPDRDEFFIFLLNAQGRIVKASGIPNQRPDFFRNGYFDTHKAYCCQGLLISMKNTGPNINDKVIYFSRRLSHQDGSFGGVVVISVQPDFLATFQDEPLVNTHDFVSVRLASGPLLVTRLGAGNKQKNIFYLGDPDLAGSQGIRLELAEKFRDKKSRYVAWRKLKDYPLVTLAGLTEEDALAGYQALARNYRLTATTASVLFLIFAAVGMWFSERLAVRRRAEENVRSTYRMATDAANEGFYMLRPVFSRDGLLIDFNIEDCNDRAAILLGSTRANLTGRLASEAMQHKLHEDLIDICRRALQSGIYEDEFRVPSQGGLDAKWVYRRAVHSGAGIALTLRDISELKAHEQTLADLANKDALTLLPNRRWLSGFLPEAVQRAQHNDSRLAIFFIDLDNFKLINDTLGHQAGDELLAQAANRICHAVRASDHVVRLGGDEFTVVLEDIAINRDISRVANSIIHILSEPFTLSAGAGNRVSASIGISVYPNDGKDADTLLKHADVAMYAAKAEGKARHRFYHSKLSDAILLRLSKERALRQAIDNDEFIIYYQPRVSTHTGRLCSLEALLRWRHPVLGLVHPLDFIDVAEDAGLIISIGETVIEKVAMQLDDWRHRGLRVVPVSVNISPFQLHSGTTAAYFEKIVKQYQLPTDWLEVEVTESAVVDRSMVVSSELDALRKQGVRLMIDDFGAGYSSLAQLHRLDVDVLKVDQAFTQALAEGSEGEIMYRAIVSMAVALDMQVVAEGVETLAQLNLLKTIGCHEIQGHIISPALPANEIEPLLRKKIMPPFDEMTQLATV